MRSVTQDTISDYIKNQHRLIAHRAGNEIKLFLETPNTLLKVLLETKDIQDMNPFTQSLILNKVITEYQPIFDRIFTINTLGNEISTSDFGPHKTTYAHEKFFTDAFVDSGYSSSVKFNKDQEPFIITSYPIKQFEQIRGILAAEINLKSIWDLVDEIVIGESGNAFVVSGTGQLIAHPDKIKVFDRVDVINIRIINEMKQKEAGSRIFESPEGISMLGTFALIKEFDWLIVIQQPIDEALQAASTMLYQVFAFVGLVIMVAIFLAYLLEKRITAPITTLIRGVKRYAAGDLDVRITIEKYEELGVLAKEFNSMAANLSENQRKLRRIERLAAMSKFATLVSHEIRNPLNSMNINMQILKREMENPLGNAEKKQKYFDIIVSEINRMDNLIKNFLMISRPPKFDFLPNDIHQILDAVILMHRANAEQQNVIINRDFRQQKYLANVDRDQMMQVYHNVIINSLQAMPEGGKLTIKTGRKRIKDESGNLKTMLSVEFIDNGIGIPEDKIGEIFEFYYTMKKAGTGLGLAIAKQIVEGHMGYINVESIYGKGTTISISLPSIEKQRDFSRIKNTRAGLP